MLKKYLPFLKEETINPKLLVYPQKTGELNISYPKVSRRIYAASFDLMLITFISYPLIHFITWIFKSKFEVVKEGQQIIMSYLSKDPGFPSLIKAFNDPRIMNMDFMNNYILSQILTQGTVLALSIGFLIWVNNKYSTSPGKWLFGLRILDSRTYSKPNIFQLVVRNISSVITAITFLVPMIFAKFELRHRAIHDLIANTVVVRLTKPKAPKVKIS
ncbi:MAG: RDD family protein [Alphaproteobacteria bacterium]|nr:RDD family protein [Alphaproteobacteria bacterium]OJV15831.1 MAG: hypothetical protein BGO27_07955 [Alphaproteobacteria bacterium 33-17]